MIKYNILNPNIASVIHITRALLTVITPLGMGLEDVLIINASLLLSITWLNPFEAPTTKKPPITRNEKVINENEKNVLRYINPHDIRSYGLIPEIIGRLPVMCHLNPLTKDALRDIMTIPKNALIKQYTRLFEMDDINFSISPGAIDYIVDKAYEFKLGARGLRTLCEAILNDAMFNLPSSGENELKITKLYADEKLQKIDLSYLKAVS